MKGPALLAAIVPDELGIESPAKLRFSEQLSASGKTDAFPPVLVAESIRLKEDPIFGGMLASPADSARGWS